MIPESTQILLNDFEIKSIPSKNYRLIIDKDSIKGSCDGKDAVKQAIYKIINTERYKHVIYSLNYGIELKDLFGQSVSFVCSELKRRINEALTQDDRIEECYDFEFEMPKKGVLYVKFKASTSFGEVESGMEVNY